MPNFDDLILSVTARLSHETDFAFAEHKGEIANRLRSKFSGITLSGEPVRLVGITLDDDGDIRIQTDRGSSYVTPQSLILIGWLTTPGSLAEGLHLTELPSIMESMLEEIGGLRPESYHLRILFSTRFASPEGLNLLRSRLCDMALES